MAADSPLPLLSFPAILRNPGLSNRYAHLHDAKTQGDTYKSHKSNSAHVSIHKNRRDQNEGRRWVRRKDNARLVGNSHIVAATKSDYTISPPHKISTFPEPLPSYLPRTVKLPTTPTLPATDPASANAGRFSLGLKGMRRDLRRAGGRAEALIRDVEYEMIQWLALGGTILAPDNRTHSGDIQSTPIGCTGTIFEVDRTPLQLIWKISDDAFARYIVHCCARYHEIISFSKGTSDNRLTYLLRPNVTRPDRRAPAALDTPPITDLDYSSNPDTDNNLDSDFVSEHDLESDIELGSDANFTLPAIKEASLPVSPALPPVNEDAWSLVDEETDDDSLVDDLESGSEFESAQSILRSGVEALSLVSQPSIPSTQPGNPDHTLTEIRPHPLRDSPSARRREWTSARSPSSPSRSPVRTRPRRHRLSGKNRVPVGLQAKRSFYEYIFL